MNKENIQVIKLSTEYYKKGDRLIYSRVISPVKRKSTGFQILDEEVH